MCSLNEGMNKGQTWLVIPIGYLRKSILTGNSIRWPIVSEHKAIFLPKIWARAFFQFLLCPAPPSHSFQEHSQGTQMKKPGHSGPFSVPGLGPWSTWASSTSALTLPLKFLCAQHNNKLQPLKQDNRSRASVSILVQWALHPEKGHQLTQNHSSRKPEMVFSYPERLDGEDFTGLSSGALPRMQLLPSSNLSPPQMLCYLSRGEPPEPPWLLPMKKLST